MNKKPGEIQFPPQTPEIRPPQEPATPGRPATDPEIVPGQEPGVPGRPAEIPEPPKSLRIKE